METGRETERCPETRLLQLLGLGAVLDEAVGQRHGHNAAPPVQQAPLRQRVQHCKRNQDFGMQTTGVESIHKGRYYGGSRIASAASRRYQVSGHEGLGFEASYTKVDIRVRAKQRKSSDSLVSGLLIEETSRQLVLRALGCGNKQTALSQGSRLMKHADRGRRSRQWSPPRR